MRRLLFFSLFVASSVFASAQQPAPDMPPVTVTQPYLSPTQIQTAIDRGLSSKEPNIGIHIVDVESSIQAGMSCNDCGAATYTVHAFTPMQWIESRAALAKHNKRPFTADSITPSMRSPAFRVFVYQVRHATGKMELPDPIQDVQLTDSKHKETLKALTEKEKDARGERADSSGSVSGSNEATVFDMADVDKLSSNGIQDIFLMITMHSGHTRSIKLKAQDLKQ